jgi:transposase-like protein
MQTAARRSRRSSLQIDAILEEFSSSGLSQSAFARQHGITQSFLSVRLKKARAQETLQPRHAVRFIEIEHPTHSLKPAIRLLFSGDIVVEAPHEFDAAELGVVLSLVKATFAPQSSGSKQ